MTQNLIGLHVEDAVDVFSVLRAVLGTHNIGLRHAIDRTQFLSEVSGPLDFIIFDGCIPGWDLQDYLSDIRAFCKVPFFVYSGNKPSQLTPFYQIGAKGVFSKSDGFESLCACICSQFNLPVKSISKVADPGS